jgi:hypothetical protein
MKGTTLGFMLLAAVPAAAQEPLPVIDMHLHALTADANGPPPCCSTLSQLVGSIAIGTKASPDPVATIG